MHSVPSDEISPEGPEPGPNRVRTDASRGEEQPQTQIEAIVFRYIEQQDATKFEATMESIGISLDTAPDESQFGTDIHTPSTSYWDYPSFHEQAIRAEGLNEVRTSIAWKQLTLAELCEIQVVRIDDPPAHYPYRYVLSFRFRLSSVPAYSDKTATLALLQTATSEMRRFTDDLTAKARFRPIYWFIKDLPTGQRGLRGAMQRVQGPDDAPVEIERGFPHSSYIVYDFLPSARQLSWTDLGLVSVIAHVVERGYRPILESTSRNIEIELEKLDTAELIQSHSPRELRERLLLVEAAQRIIRREAKRFYETRRIVIRLRGLVQRIRQIGGNPDSRTIYDIVCDDAITQIADEVAMSEEQIESGINSASDVVSLIHSQINDRYGKLTAIRTRRLQELAVLLQSTGVAFVIFQITERLWNVPARSEAHLTAQIDNGFCCWSVDPFLVFRAVSILGIAAAAFVATYLLLKRRVQGRPRGDRNTA
jgi:hypothetical protein